MPVQAMIPGPFVDREMFTALHRVEFGDDQAERTYRAVARLMRQYPERFLMRDGNDEIHLWRHRPTSSLRAFYLWLAAAFAAGVLLTLLVVFAFSAEGSTSSRSFVEPSAVRAGRMVEARSADEGMADQRDRARSTSSSSTDPARTTAIGELPASASSASPRTMTAPLRDDPVAPGRASPVPRSLVAAAAVRHGIDPEYFVAVLTCESHLYPDRVGAAGEIGPAQFMRGTFVWFASESGLGFVASDVDIPERNIELAAWAMANGYASHWTCAK